MMNMNRWLWLLWGAMIVSMILKWQADTYMIVALIVLLILIVLLDLHEEIGKLKDENRHQRKFVLDRYNILQERLKEMATHIEKRMVVDFAELAKDSLEKNSDSERRRRIKNKAAEKNEEEENLIELSDSLEDDEDSNTYLDEESDIETDSEDFEDI